MLSQLNFASSARRSVNDSRITTRHRMHLKPRTRFASQRDPLHLHLAMRSAVPTGQAEVNFIDRVKREATDQTVIPRFT